MSLDKAALESLRLDRDSDPKRYQESGTGRRRWRILAVVAAVIVADRMAGPELGGAGAHRRWSRRRRARPMARY